MVLKLFRTIRDNWKKSVFFSCVALYGAHWGKGKYDDNLLRDAYCKEAKKYGEYPLRTGERARRVTVFLNPAASNGSGRKLFEKNAAPLLYLAGMEVTVVKTEYAGQAKRYMDVLESESVDAIVVAGGDGTLSEVITGLLRRDEEKFCSIPIGVVPVGQTNTLATSLLFKGDTKSNVRWMLEAAMSVILGVSKPVDVMQIKGNKEESNKEESNKDESNKDESKTVYAVTGIQWGAFRDAENRKKKYWYFGPLKHRLTYVVTTLRYWPPFIEADLSYQLPCDGCSKCYVPPPVPQWRWWHIFFAPRRPVVVKDYSAVVNEECGVEHKEQFTSLELSSVTCNNRIDTMEQSERAIEITLHPGDSTQTEFIYEGWDRVKKRVDAEKKRCIRAGQFKMQPHIPEGKAAWFTIDNEAFEVMPIEVKLLKNKLNVFHSLQKDLPSLHVDIPTTQDILWNINSSIVESFKTLRAKYV